MSRRIGQRRERATTIAGVVIDYAMGDAALARTVAAHFEAEDRAWRETKRRAA